MPPGFERRHHDPAEAVLLGPVDVLAPPGRRRRRTRPPGRRAAREPRRRSRRATGCRPGVPGGRQLGILRCARHPRTGSPGTAARSGTAPRRPRPCSRGRAARCRSPTAPRGRTRGSGCRRRAAPPPPAAFTHSSNVVEVLLLDVVAVPGTRRLDVAVDRDDRGLVPWRVPQSGVQCWRRLSRSCGVRGISITMMPMAFLVQFIQPTGPRTSASFASSGSSTSRLLISSTVGPHCAAIGASASRSKP